MNLWTENVETRPKIGAIVVNEPRFLFRNITQAFLIETVEVGIVINLLKVPFQQFELKRSVPSPALFLLLNDQRMHGPSCSFLRFLRVQNHHEV